MSIHDRDLAALARQRSLWTQLGHDPQTDPPPEDVIPECRPDVARDIAILSEAALTPWPPKEKTP